MATDEKEITCLIVTESGDRCEIKDTDIRSLSLPDGLNASARLELLINPMEAMILLERLWELPEFRLDQTLH